eukprot:12904189-Prorocentrum_lima.AAC.1
MSKRSKERSSCSRGYTTNAKGFAAQVYLGKKAQRQSSPLVDKGSRMYAFPALGGWWSTCT